MDTALKQVEPAPGLTVPATPPPAPLSMPKQDLRSFEASRERAQTPGLPTRAARIFVFGGALALTAVAVDQMIRAVAVSEVTPLQAAMVGLFVLTFGWIALSTTSALAGIFFARPDKPRRAEDGQSSFDTTGPCALLMPVYNEDPTATTAALFAMAEDLDRLGEARNFEIFILSDTTDPDVLIVETAAVARLRDRLRNVMPVWYRHRHRNVDRKSGNLHDFIERWGARYETMLVLDADSLMTGRTIRELRERISADPNLGLLQTVPELIGRDSLFARIQQFAGRVYGPVVARGLASWQGDDGNYWGHNAILRTRAFAEACGLPHLPGKPPFGGGILSHDFVEAALMRRAGWKVHMAPDLEGSWEASPPSLLDSASRDRRWAQGNLQHLSVIGTKGLAWPSRVHFAMGVMSYVSSPLWFLLIFVGFALTVQAYLLRPKYFTQAFQLFPTWPRFDSERMIWLFVLTMGALMVPKIIGLIHAFVSGDHGRSPRAVLRLVSSWITEVLLSALFAPITMLIQTRHVWDILIGRDVGWKLQRRDDGSIGLGEAVAHHWGHCVLGIVMAAAIYPLSPAVLAWLSPVLIGWMFAVPVSWASGSIAAGKALRRLGLLTIPEEITPPFMLTISRGERERAAQELAGISVEKLLDDPELADRHFALAGEKWPVVRGNPDVDYLTLSAKIDDAATRPEVLAWLKPSERMRLLCSRHAFESLRRLPSPQPG